MNTAEQRWEKLVGDFRQLCLLRRQKKWIESDIMLNSDLPRSIAGWSETVQIDPREKKTRLDAMFQAEQRRMDDAWITLDLVTSRLKEEILPEICAQLANEVRASLTEQVRAAVLEEALSTIKEQTHIAATEAIQTVVAQQVGAAVTQEVGVAVRVVATEEPAPERKPTGLLRNSELAAGRGSRVAFDDIPGIFDLVLAEEQVRQNNHQLELSSACP